MFCVSTEEQPGREGAHHQAAEGGAETGGSQAGAAEETSTEPDPEGHAAEGKRSNTNTGSTLRVAFVV